MGMNLNDQGATFERPPSLEPGTYPARTVGIVDLGLQPQSYNGEDKPPQRMVSVTYEFTDEFLLDEDGQEDKKKPRWLSEQFALFHIESEKAKSTQRYKALDPANDHHGDFLSLVDIPINVTVVQNPNKKNPDRPWENVAAISTMRTKDALNTPELVNKPFVFDLEEPNLDAYAQVPKWLKKTIEGNLEYNGSLFATLLGAGDNPPPTEAQGEDLANQELSDEVPF